MERNVHRYNHIRVIMEYNGTVRDTSLNNDPLHVNLIRYLKIYMKFNLNMFLSDVIT